MGDVPSEVLQVPRFGTEYVSYDERPGCTVFAVKTQVQPGFTHKIWWKKSGHERLSKHYDNIPKYEEINWHGGFVNGLPIIKFSVPVPTCAGSRRPRKLYRVTHDEQPNEGKKARGYGSVGITQLHFQMQVAQHMVWQCRNPSPFLSATDQWKKVEQIIRALRRAGKTGIRIHVFLTSGPGWDHKKQRLFFVPDIGRSLGIEKYWTDKRKQREYLLESHIPPESIKKTIEVEDGFDQVKPRKRKEGAGRQKERKPMKRRCTDFRREN
ncbi:hypothetical protein F5Y08DRAFT_342433 [Xylaria arbuscula]|nr:hypothetical protein F5Y08DRAFT_342433 [Xylaria arbuscula]